MLPVLAGFEPLLSATSYRQALARDLLALPAKRKEKNGSADFSRKTSAISTRCYNYLTTEPLTFR